MKVVNKLVSELRPYENNPRINGNAVEYVAKSIKEFGFKVPLVIDTNDVVVCGHTRLLACEKLGIKEVPCVIADDLSEEQIKAYRLADNKVGEIAEWDIGLLNLELDDITLDMSEFGFNDIFEEEPKEPKEREDLSDKVHETLEVIIECESELQQEEVFYRLTEEGYKCRVLTL